jgi:hypothetical protein
MGTPHPADWGINAGGCIMPLVGTFDVEVHVYLQKTAATPDDTNTRIYFLTGAPDGGNLQQMSSKWDNNIQLFTWRSHNDADFSIDVGSALPPFNGYTRLSLDYLAAGGLDSLTIPPTELWDCV